MQNLGQFENRYPNGLSDEIIGNTDTRISMGITDVKTANYFCDLIGVSTVETTSIRKSNSLEGEIEEYGEKNVSTQKRNLLNVDEILRIPTTQLIVNLRGNKPLLLDKVIYTEHKLYSKLKDSSITAYAPKWTINTPKENLQAIPKKETTSNEKIGWNNF